MYLITRQAERKAAYEVGRREKGRGRGRRRREQGETEEGEGMKGGKRGKGGVREGEGEGRRRTGKGRAPHTKLSPRDTAIYKTHSSSTQSSHFIVTPGVFQGRRKGGIGGREG